VIHKKERKIKINNKKFHRTRDFKRIEEVQKITRVRCVNEVLFVAPIKRIKEVYDMEIARGEDDIYRLWASVYSWTTVENLN